jgi:hypothetical protein
LLVYTHTRARARADKHKLTPWSRVLVETLIVVFPFVCVAVISFVLWIKLERPFLTSQPLFLLPLFSVTVVLALTSTFTSHITSLNNVKYINLWDATLITH